jgi:hypothetical protein
MRPLFEDFDEFEFEDSPTVARLLREHRRTEARRTRRMSAGPKHHRYLDEDDEPNEGYGGYGSYHEDSKFSDYDDYDEEEFDLYAGLSREH